MTAAPPSDDALVPPAPNGIRGWLIVPAIGLTVGCAMGVINLAQALSVAPDAFAAGYGGMLSRALALDAGQVAFTILATVRFFGRKRNAPRIIMALFVVGVVIDGYLLIAAQGGDPLLAGRSAVSAFVRSALISCVWISYFSVSKRVKATFVN